MKRMRTWLAVKSWVVVRLLRQKGSVLGLLVLLFVYERCSAVKRGGLDEVIGSDKQQPEATATESLRGVAASKRLGQVSH